MKATLSLLLAIVLLGILGDLWAPYRTPVIETRILDVTNPVDARPIALPLALDADPRGTHVVRVRPIGSQYALGGHVLVEASGAPIAAALRDRDGALVLGPGEPRCSTANVAGRWTCQVPFRFEGSGWVDFSAAPGATTVHRLEPVLIKASTLATVGIGSLLALFGTLSLLGLLLLGLRLAPAPRAHLLAIFGAVWLFLAGVTGALFITALLAAFYLLLRLQIARPDARTRLLSSLLFLVAAFLAVRQGLPWLWQAFANPAGLQLAVPLGFAFLLIRAADLALRVATRELNTLGLGEYLTYMLFPATLAAGPVMTLPQFRAGAMPTHTLTDWSAGLARIGIGLAKKMAAEILLTRIAGPRIGMLYSDPDGILPGEIATLLLANAAYVYLDFSGYSDIAIGVARQLGWRVPENFEFPFLRSNMRSFWQSWHITLSAWVSRWMHFYCMFQLRHAPALPRAVLPVVISLLLIGLWHEIQLTWLLWGLHHAVGILIGDAWRAWFIVRLPRAGPAAALRPVAWLAGVAFVWTWVAMSQCFTLVSDPALALRTYLRLFVPGGD